DGNSPNQYSLEGANASICVAESTATGGDWAIWQEFHANLFADIESGSSRALTAPNIIDLAGDAGAGDGGGCINNGSYGEWIERSAQEIMSEPEFTGTPTVLINGQPWDWQSQSPEDLVDAVNAAVEAAE